MRRFSLLALISLGVLSGCATGNSTFSCNETAIDRCLTIEEVDRMTSFADDYNSLYPTKFSRKRIGSLNKKPIEKESSNEVVWIAPYKDLQGIAHQEQIIKSFKANA